MLHFLFVYYVQTHIPTVHVWRLLFADMLTYTHRAQYMYEDQRTAYMGVGFLFHHMGPRDLTSFTH